MFRTLAMPRGRLRTRLFAGRCVLELPGAVGSDRRHFDLAAAQGGNRGLRQKLSGRRRNRARRCLHLHRGMREFETDVD